MTYLRCLLLLSVVLAAGAAVPAVPRPNILLVLLDDVSARDVEESYTPQLDALAASGVSFSRAYSLPTCLATRRALWFGEIHRPPLEWSACGEGPGPRLGQPSLPSALSGAGYECALIGKWHTVTNGLDWRYSPQFHGFDTWRAGIMGNMNQCGGSSYTNWVRVDDGAVTTETVYVLEAVRDATLGWLAEPHAGPTFTVVSFQSPHGPYEVPPAGLLPPGYVVPPLPNDRQKYEAMLAAADHALGQIVAAAGPDTVVFVMGDNGTPTSICPPGQAQHGKTHAGERGNRVPLVVVGPYIGQGTSSALVQASDLYATIAHALCLRGLDTGRDGVSFLLPMLNPSLPGARSQVYTFTHALWWKAGSVREDALVEARWKYRVVGGVESWYDLSADPDEEAPMNELAVELLAPGTVARTRAELLEVQ